MAHFHLSAFADEASSQLEGQIAALLRNDLHFVELRNVNGMTASKHPDDVLKEMAKKFADNGIAVSSMGSPIGKIQITDDFAPHVEDFKRTLEAANILGAKKIRMFSFFMPKGGNPADYRNEVLERLNVLLELSEAAGVDCCHENEKDIYGDTAARCIDLYQAFGGRLKAIFDPANYIQCGESPEKIFDELYPHLDYMHIKDALHEDGSVVPAGKGDGHIPEITQKFAQKEGDRFLTLEPHLTVFDGLAGLQDDELKHKYAYASADEAFDVAVNALKEILTANGAKFD